LGGSNEVIPSCLTRKKAKGRGKERRKRHWTPALFATVKKREGGKGGKKEFHALCVGPRKGKEKESVSGLYAFLFLRTCGGVEKEGGKEGGGVGNKSNLLRPNAMRRREGKRIPYSYFFFLHLVSIPMALRQ